LLKTPLPKETHEAVYSNTVDILQLFAPQIAHNPTFEPLLTTASDNLIAAFKSYLNIYVFEPAMNGAAKNTTESRADKNQDLLKRRKFLAAYCKLFAWKWIDMVHGAEVLMHYLKCYQDYGDIIKEAISKTRNIDQTTSAHTLVTALQKMYKNLLNSNDGVLDKSSPDFAQLKELARRFALTFGLDTNRTRDAVSELHKWGIEFALKVYPGENLPRYMSFLDVLTEFSTKLIKQDRPLIVGHLKRRLPQGVEPQEEEEYWTPFVTYRNTLVPNEGRLRNAPARGVQRVNQTPQYVQQPTQNRQRRLSNTSVMSTDSIGSDMTAAGMTIHRSYMESTAIPQQQNQSSRYDDSSHHQYQSPQQQYSSNQMIVIPAELK